VSLVYWVWRDGGSMRRARGAVKQFVVIGRKGG
jgi:hypothetical protein